MPSPPPPAEIEYELAHIHDDRRKDLIVSTVICITVACIAVVLRLWARRLSKAKILADDYMIIVALFICVGQVAAVLYAVHLGEGRHVVLLKNVPAYAKSIIAQEVLYCIGTSTFKFSALLLFHRIFNTVSRFTPILWAIAAVILANNIAEIFLSIFQCNPVHKAWDPETKGSCVNILLAACIPGSINVISDLVVAMLPIPMIWRLHMQTSRKVQLLGFFLVSGFVCIASTYRTIVVKRLSHQDATWADVDPSIWAVVENAIGILCASLPTMRPIFVLFRKGHFCSSSKQQYCERCSTKIKSYRDPRSNGSRSNAIVSNDWKKGDPTSYANIESVEKGSPTTLKGPTTTFEMC